MHHPAAIRDAVASGILENQIVASTCSEREMLDNGCEVGIGSTGSHYYGCGGIPHLPTDFGTSAIGGGGY